MHVAVADELAKVPQAGQLFGFLRTQPTALCQPAPGFPPGAAGSAEECAVQGSPGHEARTTEEAVTVEARHLQNGPATSRQNA